MRLLDGRMPPAITLKTNRFPVTPRVSHTYAPRVGGAKAKGQTNVRVRAQKGQKHETGTRRDESVWLR